MRRWDPQKLRALREGLGLSRCELARRIRSCGCERCHDTLVGSWEAGGQPGADYLMALADALGIPIGDLYDGGRSAEELVADQGVALDILGITLPPGRRRRRRPASPLEP